MTKLTIFFTILFILALGGRIAAGYFAASVPFLGAITRALTGITVGFGVVAFAFVIVIIIKEIKGDKK